MCGRKSGLKLIKKVVIVVLALISAHSLFGGYFLSFFVQIAPIVFNYATSKYPDNILVRIAGTPLSPALRNGILASEYSSKMALFASKWLFIIMLIFSLTITFELDVNSNQIFLGVFAFGLPIFAAMAILTIVFHTLKYVYIRVSGRDKIWLE